MSEGCVYFAHATGGGPIKIGASFTPIGRMQGLATFIPQGVEMITSLPGHFGREGFLKKALSPWQMNGEWFRSCTAVWRVIFEIDSGSVPTWIPLVDDFPARERADEAKRIASSEEDRASLRRLNYIGAGKYGQVLFGAMLARGELPEWLLRAHLPFCDQVAERLEAEKVQ